MANASSCVLCAGNNSLESNATLPEISTDKESGTAKGLKVCAYVLVLIASLVGNVFMISAMKKDYRGKLRRRFTYLMITSIAVADLLMAAVSIPERITRVLSADQWLISGTIGLILCKVVNFVEKVSITVSALHVMAMAAHRFMAIFSSQRTSKSKNCRIATVSIAVVWFFSALYWSPVLYYGGLLSVSSRLYCKVRYFYPQWRISYLVFLILLLAILLIVLVLYAAIWLKLSCSKTVRDQTVSVAAEMRRRSTTMVAVIVATFYCCFLPYWIGWILCEYQQIFCNHVFTFISIYLTHASVAVNPVICLIFSRHYREALSELFAYNGHHAMRQQRTKL